MTTECTLEHLNSVIAKYGVLQAGRHDENSGACCILEAYSECVRLKWTDDPVALNTWDIRHINDIKVPVALRTEWMPRVMAAYANCRDWPIERQMAVAAKISILTINRIIANLPYNIDSDAAARCKNAQSLEEAKASAAATADTADTARAASNAYYAASCAARTAANASALAAADASALAAADASYASYAAASAADAEVIFLTACEIWFEAATEGLEAR